jgi:hypothetical protein
MLLRSKTVERRRPHIVRVPPHGRLALALSLDAASLREGYSIEAEPTPAGNGVARGEPDDATTTRLFVVLPENLSIAN